MVPGGWEIRRVIYSSKVSASLTIWLQPLLFPISIIAFSIIYDTGRLCSPFCVESRRKWFLFQPGRVKPSVGEGRLVMKCRFQGYVSHHSTKSYRLSHVYMHFLLSWCSKHFEELNQCESPGRQTLKNQCFLSPCIISSFFPFAQDRTVQARTCSK